MKDIKERRAQTFVLSGFLILGLVAGMIFAWIFNDSLNFKQYNLKQLTSDIIYDNVEEGRLQCKVVQDKAPMYNIPSTLYGNIIEHMSQGVYVDYFETVSSQDKDERYAVTAVEMKFQRFWGRKHIIPKGTKVLILSQNDGVVWGRVYVEDRFYEKEFDVENLRMPYIGQWKRVEFHGKPGYMQFNSLAESKVM